MFESILPFHSHTPKREGGGGGGGVAQEGSTRTRMRLESRWRAPARRRTFKQQRSKILTRPLSVWLTISREISHRRRVLRDGGGSTHDRSFLGWRTRGRWKWRRKRRGRCRRGLGGRRISFQKNHLEHTIQDDSVSPPSAATASDSNTQHAY